MLADTLVPFHMDYGFVCHATFAMRGGHGPCGVSVARWVADGSGAQGLARLRLQLLSAHHDRRLKEGETMGGFL